MFYKMVMSNFEIFKKDFIYLLLEKGERREKEKERNSNAQEISLPLTHPQLGTWPATQACALTGNQTRDLSVHRPALKSTEATAGRANFDILSDEFTFIFGANIFRE